MAQVYRARDRMLQRKTDELIEKGKISPAAAGRVRQAVAQFSKAVPSG